MTGDATPPLRQSAGVFAAISRIRQNAKHFTTSFFATPEQTQGWLDEGGLSCAESAGCLLVFRRDRDFQHLCHVADSLESLSEALATLALPAGGGAAYTADLVGRLEQTAPVAGVYQEHGFRTLTTLFRMFRLAGSALMDYQPDPEVVFAEPADVPMIAAFFDRLLNRFVDQIPDRAQLLTSAEQRAILLIRRGAAPGGVLLFENVGLTTLLRYWYVDERFRHDGIGGRLIRTFLHLCGGSKRILLWVIADNADAIAKYRHYGFAKENLVDQIMFKRWRNE
jgi:GNAT superfamily N-acetyltransferase